MTAQFLRLATTIVAVIISAQSYPAQSQQVTPQRPPDPTIEIYIPEGMSDMIIGEPDGPHIGRYSTLRFREQASIAWASEAKVTRIIFVVERLDTETGSWVLESDSPQADLKAIAEKGKEALPRARFIPKEPAKA